MSRGSSWVIPLTEELLATNWWLMRTWHFSFFKDIVAIGYSCSSRVDRHISADLTAQRGFKKSTEGWEIKVLGVQWEELREEWSQHLIKTHYMHIWNYQTINYKRNIGKFWHYRLFCSFNLLIFKQSFAELRQPHKQNTRNHGKNKQPCSQ